MIELELPGAVQQHDGTWTKNVILDETTAVEENILADQKRIRGKLAVSEASRITQVLSRCTVSVGTDKRPNGIERGTAGFLANYFDTVWEQAAIYDRATATIGIRQYSVGDKFTFDEECPNKLCERGKLEGITVDLGDIATKTATIEEVKRVCAGITDRLPRSGKMVKWRALIGTDEPRIKHTIETHEADLVTASMFLRVMEIDGQTLSAPSDLDSLPSGDLAFLRQRFDDVEYGPDTSIEVCCDDQFTMGSDGKPVLVSKGCGTRFWMKLPTGKRSFFFPSGSSRSLRVICSSYSTFAASTPAIGEAASDAGS